MDLGYEAWASLKGYDLRWMTSGDRKDIVAIIIVILSYLGLPILLLSFVLVTFLAVSSLFRFANWGFWNVLEFAIYVFLSLAFFYLLLLMVRWHKRKGSLSFLGEEGQENW